MNLSILLIIFLLGISSSSSFYSATIQDDDSRLDTVLRIYGKTGRETVVPKSAVGVAMWDDDHFNDDHFNFNDDHFKNSPIKFPTIKPFVSSPTSTVYPKYEIIQVTAEKR
jgi:hypothetical protein